MDNVNVLRNGFIAPDFSLPDSQGNIFNLKQKVDNCFIALCFFSNGGKERINSYLKDLNQGLPKTGSGLTVNVIGICPETGAHLNQLKEKLKLAFRLLSDRKSVVASRYYLADNSSHVPANYFSVVVIDDTGIIRHRVTEIPGVSKYNPEELKKEISRLI